VGKEGDEWVEREREELGEREREEGEEWGERERERRVGR
jgi:hypothetical protein